MAIKRKHKYNAKRTLGFASKIEAERAQYLELKQKAHAISDLETQPGSITLAKAVRYKADAYYKEYGIEIWEDTKGVITDRYRIIKSLWKHWGPGILRTVTRDRSGRWHKEDIISLAWSTSPHTRGKNDDV